MIDRIKSVMEYYHLSPAQFADRIGFQRSALSHVLSGRNNPSLDFVLKVKNTFPNINLEWLTMGEGNQFINPEQQNVDPVQETLKMNLDDDPVSTPVSQIPKETNEKTLFTEENFRETKADEATGILKKAENQVFNGEKKIKKVILLYNDGSFSEHFPEK